MRHTYPTRHAAGHVLAQTLTRHPFKTPPVVIALPRGGIPVGFEIAQALRAPLDFLVVRKIGAPGHSELACGAFITGGEVVWNTSVLNALRLTTEDLRATHTQEMREAKEREEALRTPEISSIPLVGRSVVLVDDGIATGATIKAAIKGLLRSKVAELIVAIPVAPTSSCREIEKMGVDLVCDQRIDEEHFSSVGEWYEEFPQVPTAECKELLERNRREGKIASL